MTNPAILEQDGADPLRDAYHDFWREVSQGSLTLERFFARQSLHGGYVSRRANHRHYEPFLLTDRGSVFVLTIEDEVKARPLLDTWNVQGLPTPEWVSRRYTPNGAALWQRCPYLPQNGFGEIEIDLECHTTKRFPLEQTGVAI